MHGARLQIEVDLGAATMAPLAGCDHRVQATVPMRRPKMDGLRSPDEAEALYALEDALLAALPAIAELHYVGRVIGVGQLQLFWYGRDPKAHRPAMASAVKTVAGDYQVKLQATHDPEWSFYFDFLFPDVYNLQVMLNRRRLLTLADHGDDGVAERLVDHLAFFDGRDAAVAAATQLREHGFETDAPETEAPDDAEEPLRFVLRFRRVDHLAEGRIDDVCIEVLDLLLAHDGDYDGWGVEVRSPAAIEGER
jgi:hypothetical protein